MKINDIKPPEDILKFMNDNIKYGWLDINNEKEAIKKINDYYGEMAEGKSRPVTEFFEVKPGLSFKEFNEYINSLDEE